MATFLTTRSPVPSAPPATTGAFRASPLTTAKPATGLSRIIAKATAPSSGAAPVPTRTVPGAIVPTLGRFIGTPPPSPIGASGGRTTALEKIANSLNPFSPTSSNSISIVPPNGQFAPPSSPTPLSITPTADSGAPLALPGSPLPYQPSPYSGGGGGGGGGGANPSYDGEDDYGYDASGNPLPAPLPPAEAPMSTEKKVLIGGGVALGLGILYALSKGRRS